MRFFLVPAYISILLVTLLAGCSSPQKVQLTVQSRGEMSNRAESSAKELMSRFQYPDR
ncbi:hypothetical protein OGM63_20015 [Plectonema radiosum NIES-515]|uniref:Uncharacterized protein n=1 Tax=Plectonema radiosum NIES-515 TaxID=2986073 RepID=A0ABT3B315_9CYAN|nr:hypothetical protein [Plectonema radiosum]MCV3215767.1 hypothetical protein [Plectonema radiosum NIES-515]